FHLIDAARDAINQAIDKRTSSAKGEAPAAASPPAPSSAPARIAGQRAGHAEPAQQQSTETAPGPSASSSVGGNPPVERHPIGRQSTDTGNTLASGDRKAPLEERAQRPSPLEAVTGTTSRPSVAESVGTAELSRNH